MKTQTSRNKAIRFIGWTIGISWLVGFILFSYVSSSSQVQFAFATLFFGFIPATIALILNKLEAGNWVDLKFFIPEWKNALGAFLAPIIYFGMVYFAQYYFEARSIPDFTKAGSSLELALTIIIGFPVLLFLVLGEEIGWRGYLQEKLINSLGNLKGIIILGLVWGLWHLPVAIHGYNLPTYPLIESFVTYPLLGIALSLLIAYFGFNRYSIWIGAILHASNNHFGGILFALTETKNELFHAMSFVVLYLLVIFIFGFLYYKKSNALQQPV